LITLLKRVMNFILALSLFFLASSISKSHLAWKNIMKDILPRSASGRGHVQEVECGKRFGDALLGRGHGRDLDSDSEYGEYPWHVGILSSLGQGGSLEYLCGGALIDSEHILTAAHCVKSFYADEVIVRLGDWDVNTDMEPYAHMEFAVDSIFVHEWFFSASLQNDLAILRLSRHVNWNKLPQVSPVCLPSPGTFHPGDKCWVTGWGQDAFRGHLQARLQEVDVPLVRPKDCQAALRSSGLGRRFRMHPGWICAGGEEGKDACTGDGGGPLVCPGPDGRMELVGLVSWGVGCGEEGLPGVYTNIAHYVDWIWDTIVNH